MSHIRTDPQEGSVGSPLITFMYIGAMARIPSYGCSILHGMIEKAAHFSFPLNPSNFQLTLNKQ